MKSPYCLFVSHQLLDVPTYLQVLIWLCAICCRLLCTLGLFRLKIAIFIGSHYLHLILLVLNWRTIQDLSIISVNIELLWICSLRTFFNYRWFYQFNSDLDTSYLDTLVQTGSYYQAMIIFWKSLRTVMTGNSNLRSFILKFYLCTYIFNNFLIYIYK